MKYYSPISTLGHRLSELTHTMPAVKDKHQTLSEILKNPFTEEPMPELAALKLGNTDSPQFRMNSPTMQVLQKSKELILTTSNKYTLLKALHSAVSPTFNLESAAKAFTVLRVNEELMDFNQEIRQAAGVLFQAIDKGLRDKKLTVKDLRIGSDGKYGLIENLVHFLVQPGTQDKYPAIREHLLSHRLLEVPPVQEQTLEDLKSLSSILGHAVNVKVRRSETGRLLDDSDLDKFQDVVSNV